MKQSAIILLVAIFSTFGLAGYKLFCVYTHPIKYQNEIIEISSKHNLDASIVASLINVESSYKENAKSNKNAIGLMQITKETFDDIRDRILNDGHMDAGMRYDPETNIKYGVRYLSYLHDRFGHWDTAILAYFEGETRVAEWLDDKTLDPEKDGLLNTVPQGYDGGKNYVKKVNDSWKQYDKLYKK